MKNRKINVDRPQLKTEEILARRNFEEIVRNHQMMSKPFYKQAWFMGTTGLASLGLIIGGTLAFQQAEPDLSVLAETTTDAPPNLIVPENKLIVLTANYSEATNDLAKKTIRINPQNILPIEESFTQEEEIEEEKELTDEVNISETLPENNVMKDEVDGNDDRVKPEIAAAPDNNPSKGLGRMDISPRISDKIGGNITRNELLDNKGITTEGDVNIIHFELHLIDGLGGKVFEENGNQLNDEMREALDGVEPGETIYFENIRGKVKNGKEVRLNPLRYVLLN